MTDTILYYQLKPVTQDRPKKGDFALMNAAVLSCGLCGKVIAGMGGGAGAVCQQCGDLLNRGELRTAVKWPETANSEKIR